MRFGGSDTSIVLDTKQGFFSWLVDYIRITVKELYLQNKLFTKLTGFVKNPAYINIVFLHF